MWNALALNALAVRIDRADVEVVPPVLDRHVEVVPPGVEVGDDRVVPPVAVPVHDVAPVARGEQLLVVRVVLLRRRPRALPRADAHLLLLAHDATVTDAVHVASTP